LNELYAFEPVPMELEPRFQSHILGAQANLWTEYVASFKHVQYMAFPRMCALAEVDWSPKEERNWDDFARRLQIHLRRLDELGVNYRPVSFETAKPGSSH
jgi:hexosaminidase